MSDEPNADDGIDAELNELENRAGAHIWAGRDGSSFRLFGDLKRRARREHRIIPYVEGLFHQMHLARSLLDPDTMRERAVELIAILESEESARLLQPDFPENEYAYEVYRKLACAYDYLARATGMIEGFNSDGMHSCIDDGLAVCRRIGKMQCVNCFREYAADVYLAADDLEMARYQCQVVIDYKGDWSNRGDQRWQAAGKAAWIAVLNGDLGEACERAEQARSLCTADSVNLKLGASLSTYPVVVTSALLVGREPSAEAMDTRSRKAERNEWPELDWEFDLVDALQAACRQDFGAAIKTLSEWDRCLTTKRCLHQWFETRLRLIAACRLAGEPERAGALGRQLEQRAQVAGDWLTTRRLQRVLDEGQPASPLALLATPREGPFGVPAQLTDVATPAATTTTTTAAEEAAQTPNAESPPPPPLESSREELSRRIQQAYQDRNESMLEPILDDIVAFTPDAVTDWRDAAALICMVVTVLGDCQQGEAVWLWANQIATPFDKNGTVVNVLAHLGAALRSETNESLPERISEERIEQLFRQSLKLESGRARNFLRAGDFFLHSGNLGEAEWCFARGFRLERSNGGLALRLAEVYRRTDRPHDALNALDLCLRNGGDESRVAWDAAVIANDLGQYDLVLTYLDRFEEFMPNEPWTEYYRALAFYELGRPDAAIEAIRKEESHRGQEDTFHLHALQACVWLKMGEADAGWDALRAVLDRPLVSVDYLTVAGLADVLQRLWRALPAHAEDKVLPRQLEDRLLMAGLAPDELFSRLDGQGQEIEGINFYRCRVRQSLDQAWRESGGCLAGQESWTSYRTEWGVLARDETEAADLALQWQNRCYTSPAEVERIDLEAENFLDRVRVVWQGARWSDSVRPVD